MFLHQSANLDHNVYHAKREWCRLSASGGWRSTCCFRSPVCLQIRCGTMLARKASGRVVVTKHSRVSLDCSHPHWTPQKLNTPLVLLSDLGVRFLGQILHLLYCGTWKPFFGHFGHIQGQAHVGLFQLYPTSLPCHSSRHVETLQEISCCF